MADKNLVQLRDSLRAAREGLNRLIGQQEQAQQQVASLRSELEELGFDPDGNIQKEIDTIHKDAETLVEQASTRLAAVEEELRGYD